VGSSLKEKIYKNIFLIVTTFSLVILFLIALFLFAEALPLFKKVSLVDFLFGKMWYPTMSPHSFGILPLILASFYVSFLSAIISIPLGIAFAVYLSELAPKGIKEVLKPLVELISGFPSVVLGFFGMVVIAPWMTNKLSPFFTETMPNFLSSLHLSYLSNFFANNLYIDVGLNIANASIMLAFITIPTIASLSEDALYLVPRTYREASLSLGATKWETIKKIVLPAASSGIATAIMLGVSRAIGETMIVLMTCGGASMIPVRPFDPARPLPAAIAAEMGEAPYHSLHYEALFGIGAVLFILTLIFNILSDIARAQGEKKMKGKSV